MSLRFIILLFASLLFVWSKAQASDSLVHKPKVGLVLSGGGAKGLAHIGVLKVLEQNNVKVDYIAGTSMGAIIGGLYASGYTATELDSIFNSIDVSALIKDYIPRLSKSFYEKKNDEIYAVSLPFEKFKIGFPRSLSRGMYNYNLMNTLLAHVRHVRDFDQLNTPFLCIATDLGKGEPVVLDSGYLPQAILASGAFPTLFAPVNIDGVDLLDGGIVNNYPIEELKNMGAEIIIGVDVQDGLKSAEEIEGATDVLSQLSNYSTISQMKDKVGQTDIYIKPNIVGYSVISFAEGKAIIQTGVEAANQVLDQLQAIGREESIISEQYVPKMYNDSLYISEINIKGLDRFTLRYIHGKLGFKPNSTITYQDLDRGITRLNGTENFSAISYRFDKDNEQDILDMTLIENPINTYLKLGVHYDGLYKTAALVNITKKNFLTKSDVMSLDVGLGDNVRYNFNYFIDNGFYWSYGLTSRLSRFNRELPYDLLVKAMGGNLNIPNAPKEFNVNYADLENRLFVQSSYAQKYVFGLGFEHRFLDITSKTLTSHKNRFDYSNYLGVFANILVDSYDNKYFPRSGFLIKGEYRNFFYSSDYLEDFVNFSTISGQVGIARRISPKLSLDYRARVGAVIGKAPSVGFGYYLGGYGFADKDNIIPFYGYDFLSLGGNSYLLNSIQFDYEFLKRHHLNFSVNIANTGDDIFSEASWSQLAKYTGFAIGYGMQSVIGPLEAKFSYSPDTGRTYGYISVGFWF
ncbi:patatin-like phospholipase family protein [Myroides sp. LJL119]